MIYVKVRCVDGPVFVRSAWPRDYTIKTYVSTNITEIVDRTFVFTTIQNSNRLPTFWHRETIKTWSYATTWLLDDTKRPEYFQNTSYRLGKKTLAEVTYLKRVPVAAIIILLLAVPAHVSYVRTYCPYVSQWIVKKIKIKRTQYVRCAYDTWCRYFVPVGRRRRTGVREWAARSGRCIGLSSYFRHFRVK